MRKIFLDVGGFDGCSTQFFRKHHPNADEFEIFIFEPLPENIEKLKELEDVTVIPSAVTCYNGKISLYTGMSESGSVFQEKRTGGLNGKDFKKVNCIDFVDWFIENIEPEDYVIIKMNIEGSEYEIIQMMQDEYIIEWIDKWFVQWHYEKIKLHPGAHERIKAMIPPDKLYPWLAMFGGDGEWFKKTL